MDPHRKKITHPGAHGSAAKSSDTRGLRPQPSREGKGRYFCRQGLPRKVSSSLPWITLPRPYLILQGTATLGLTTPLARGVLNTKRTPANLPFPFLGTALSTTTSHSPRPGRTEGVPIREDVPCSLVPSHQQHSLQP